MRLICCRATLLGPTTIGRSGYYDTCTSPWIRSTLILLSDIKFATL